MAHDPQFRLRTTSWLLLYGVFQGFGMHAPAYYVTTILLHIVNTWLIYGMGVWGALGYELTAWAAGFFAVYEGHQEAVMWISAASEPLMLMFGLLAILAWILFLQKGRPLLYLASLAAFCLALVSKESAVIFAPLVALPLLFDRNIARGKRVPLCRRAGAFRSAGLPGRLLDLPRPRLLSLFRTAVSRCSRRSG